MPATVSLDNELQIIEVRLFEHVSLDDAEASIAEVLRLHDLHGIRQVLADFSEQTSVPDTLIVFDFARHMPREMRWALLGSGQNATASDMSFIETIAKNRDIPVRRFQSREDALGWLN